MSEQRNKLNSALVTLRDRGPASLAHAVCSLTLGQIQKQVLGRRYIAKKIYDYRMWLDLEDPGISRSLLLFGQRELDHKVILERVLKPGMAVFDIGANIGYYALMELGLIGPEDRMLCIEPSPSNVELLRRNLELNGVSDRVTVVSGAVSDSVGTRPIHISTQSNLNTFHAEGGGELHLSGKTIEVDTFTVPALAAEYGAPDLIRMDVEGHEVEVLNGMRPAVEAGEMAPMVIFETHRTRYSAEHDMAATLRGLFDCGYGVPLAASSSQEGTEQILARGYRGSTPIPTDGVERVIFEDISPEDCIDILCRTGGLRTVLLAKGRAAEIQKGNGSAHG